MDSKPWPSVARGMCFIFLGFFLFYFFGLLLRPAHAQPAPAPVILDKEYSADLTLTQPNGTPVLQKISVSNGKIRLSMPNSGTTIIIRPDLQKIYSVLDDQQMVMVLPYDTMKIKDRMALAGGLQGTFEPLGTDNVNGVVCSKYKYTAEGGKVYTLWADTARKIPVKMESADHSFKMSLKNYQASPQSPSLFEIPDGYQTMDMPSVPIAPGAGPGGP